jgi:hypothetical protein
MFVLRDVTGERCNGAGAVVPFAVAVGAGGAAEAPPVLLEASALEALPATIVRLQITALSVRNRKATTSFVGLRG